MEAALDRVGSCTIVGSSRLDAYVWCALSGGDVSDGTVNAIALLCSL